MRHSESPGCRAQGGAEEMDLFCGAEPQVRKRLFWVLHTLSSILYVPKIRDRKLPATERSEQVLSAHSRKLEAQCPAAHPLSHGGPPLGCRGRKRPTADARTEDRPEDSNGDHVSALSGVLPLLEDKGGFSGLNR